MLKSHKILSLSFLVILISLLISPAQATTVLDNINTTNQGVTSFSNNDGNLIVAYFIATLPNDRPQILNSLTIRMACLNPCPVTVHAKVYHTAGTELGAFIADIGSHSLTASATNLAFVPASPITLDGTGAQSTYAFVFTTTANTALIGNTVTNPTGIWTFSGYYKYDPSIGSPTILSGYPMISVDASPAFLDAPSLVAPIHRDRTTDQTPTFVWSAVDLAQSYRLMVYTEDRSFEFKKRTFNTNYTLAAGEALTVNKYLWRVRTQAANDAWGPWSQRNTLFVD